MLLRFCGSASGKNARKVRLAITLAVSSALYGAQVADLANVENLPLPDIVRNQGGHREPVPWQIGAITLVGTNSASATSVTIPAHQKGDLLLFFAYRGSSTTAPTRPVGIADMGPTNTKSGTTQSVRVGYKIATGTGDTSGTWTNATELVVHVYRPDPGFTCIPGAIQFSSSTTTTITFPALTLADSSGLSWVVGFVGCSNLTQTIGTAPSGMTNRQHITGASDQSATDDTNGGVSSWTAKTITAGTGNSVSCTVEIMCRPMTLALSNIYGHIGGGSNCIGRNQTGQDYLCPVSTKISGAGNALLFTVWYDAGATLTVTGSVNGTFGTRIAFCSGGTAGTGTLDMAVYLLPNIAAGQETITVHSTGGQGTGAAGDLQAFTYTITELFNVSTAAFTPSAGVNVQTNALSNTTGLISSISPPNNDATGGNFIYCVAGKTGGFGASTTNFVPGTGFTLLNADSNYAGSFAVGAPTQGTSKLAMFQVQPQHATITPTFSSQNESGDQWSTICVAIPIDNTQGTPFPSGMGVTRISHFATECFPTTGSPLFKMQLPVNGNLRLLCCDDPSLNTLTITDSEGNTWSSAGAGTGFWYLTQAAGAGANPNLIVYANGGGGDNELSFRCFDVIGADPSPQVISVTSNQTVTGLSSFTSSPAIAPTFATGMWFANIGLGQGPGLGITSPATGIWDLCIYTREVDFDELENADICAHGQITGPGTITHTWPITNSGATQNSTSGGIVAISGGSIPIQWVKPSAFKTPRRPGALPYSTVGARHVWPAGASGPQTFFQNLSASQSTALNLIRGAALSRSTPQSSSAAVTKQIGTSRSVTQASSGVLARSVGISRAIAEASAATLLRAFPRSLSVAQSSSASMVKSAARSLSAAQASAASISRSTAKIITATQGSALALAKSIAKAFGGISQASSASLAAIKGHFLTLVATQASALSLLKAVAVAKSANQASSVALVKIAGLVRSASQASGASLLTIKVRLLTLAVSQASALSLAKSVSVARSATQSTAATLVKSVRLARAVTQSSIATLAAVLVGVVHFVTLTVAAATSATISKSISLTRSAGASVAATLTKMIPVAMVTAQSMIVSILKNPIIVGSIPQGDSILLAFIEGRVRLSISEGSLRIDFASARVRMDDSDPTTRVSLSDEGSIRIDEDK